MSSYSRAKTIIESLLDKTYTDEKFVELIDTITNYQSEMNLSDEQKCEGFIQLWASQLEKVVRLRAETKVKKAVEEEAKLAGDEAVANL
jgi:hypothetical protein